MRSRVVRGLIVGGALALASACAGSDVAEDRVVDVGEPSDSEAPPETGGPVDTDALEDVAQVDPDADDWTFLVYVMGDNDLEPFAVEDLIEMSQAGSSDRVNIVALADRHPEYTLDDDPLDDFTDTRIYQVGQTDLSTFESPGELNVGSPDTLAEFVEYGISTFPAQRYGVVLWNHGAGWPGMGPDESDGNDILDLAEIDAGFQRGLDAVGLDSIDLVGFDACLMASYEVATTMAEHADFMLASAELEPGHGWNYAALQALVDDPAVTPEELGRTIIEGFAGQAAEQGTSEQITLSLVDLRQMGALESSLAALAAPLLADPTSAAPLLARAQAAALKFGANPDPELDSYHVDLGQVAAEIGESDPAFADTAQTVLATIDSMVVAETLGAATQGATGLSIYFPPFADVFRQGYLFLEDIPVWPDVLRSFFTAGESIPTDEQPSFLNENGQAEYFFDEDGLNLFGTFDLAAQGNIVEADIVYGILDESDGSTILIGEEPAEVSNDGSGLVAAIYDLTVLTISDGVDTDYAYLDLAIDEEAGVVTIDVPLWYVAPEDFETDALPQDVVLSLVLDLDFNILSEVYYLVKPDGTAGELSADPNGLIFPVVFNVYPDGSSEWLTLSEQGLFANLPDLRYDLEPLEPGTGLYAELVIRDFGGNTASVSMSDVVPV